MRCRSDLNMAEILSKRAQQNSFQVVHFTSARRFDDGQATAVNSPIRCGSCLCFLRAPKHFPVRDIGTRQVRTMRDVADWCAKQPDVTHRSYLARTNVTYREMLRCT